MDETVLLGHGSGGTMMKRIIDEVFFEAYEGDELRRGDDAAVLPALKEGERLAFRTARRRGLSCGRAGSSCW